MQEITMSRKTAAYKVHMDIMAAGEVAAEALSTFCRLLKTMRDDKLWQELEYSSFEAYCENAVGIKKSQAYNYIKVIEAFGEENFHSSGKLGIKKLELIAAAPEEAREKLLEDAQELTTREVEAAVKEYKAKLEAEQKAKAEAEARAVQVTEWADKQAQYAEESNKRARDAEWELGKNEKAIASLKSDLEYVKKQLEEAKNTDNNSKSEEKTKRLTAVVAEQFDKLEKLEAENERLQKELKAQPIEVQATKIVEVVPVKELAKMLNTAFGALLAANNIPRQDIEAIAKQAEFNRKEEIIEMLEGLEKIVPEYLEILKFQVVKDASVKTKTCEDCRYCEWENLQEEDELNGMILCTVVPFTDPKLHKKDNPCDMFEWL